MIGFLENNISFRGQLYSYKTVKFLDSSWKNNGFREQLGPWKMIDFQENNFLYL